MDIYRQGDVLLKRIRSIPKSSVEIENKERVVLAYGEVTGHAHALSPKQVKEYSFVEAGDVVRRFLKVISNEAQLKHEEHSTINLPKGLYEIIQQREYHPLEIRNVAD